MGGIKGAGPYVSEAQLSACQKPSWPTVTSCLGAYRFTTGATRLIQSCTTVRVMFTHACHVGTSLSNGLTLTAEACLHQQREETVLRSRRGS